MVHTQKLRKPPGREQRHSAAWGKRLAIMLLLATGMAFGANPHAGNTGRIASELSDLLDKAHQGTAQGQTVKVIVQYRQVPTAAHYATMRNRGGLLHAKLHMIKSAAFTIPVSALAALESDPEVVSVSIDHPYECDGRSDQRCYRVQSAWNAGYNGAGVGVAVIDSGINDSHPDLQNPDGTSRVVYHQDFTGTPSSNSNGAQYDLYGHGTHVAGVIGSNGSRPVANTRAWPPKSA